MATAKPPELKSMDSADLDTPKRSRFGSALKRLVLVALVLGLIGTGVVVWLLLQKKSELGSEESGENEVQAAQSVNLSVPPVFVPLDAFVVNLQAEGGERYLQVIMAARVSDAKAGEVLKSYMPEIRHRINLRLTGKLPSEINTPDGQENLAREIAADINGVLGSPLTGGANAPVHSVLFNSFIIQ